MIAKNWILNGISVIFRDWQRDQFVYRNQHGTFNLSDLPSNYTDVLVVGENNVPLFTYITQQRG
jgi:hypothetical protein